MFRTINKRRIATFLVSFMMLGIVGVFAAEPRMADQATLNKSSAADVVMNRYLAPSGTLRFSATSTSGTVEAVAIYMSGGAVQYRVSASSGQTRGWGPNGVASGSYKLGLVNTGRGSGYIANY